MSITLAGWLQRHAGLPRPEREMLLCHHLGLDRAALITSAHQAIAPDRVDDLEAGARRLRAGEPLAYITGTCGFWDLDLTVTPDVLVRRPETETLVEAALARLAPGDRVLELGTGSGAIAIVLARTGKGRVLAVDNSAAALAVARANAQRHAADVRFARSDWYRAVSGSFRLIVANPPYVAEGDPHLPALRHEPRGALVSGPRGLDAITEIVQASPDHLAPGGWLLLEHGWDQAREVRERFAAAGFCGVETLRDLGDRPRVTLGRRNAPCT